MSDESRQKCPTIMGLYCVIIAILDYASVVPHLCLRRKSPLWNFFSLFMFLRFIIFLYVKFIRYCSRFILFCRVIFFKQCIVLFSLSFSLFSTFWPLNAWISRKLVPCEQYIQFLNTYIPFIQYIFFKTFSLYIQKITTRHLFYCYDNHLGEGNTTGSLFYHLMNK